MTQSAQQGSPSGMSAATDRLRQRADVAARLAGRGWSILVAQVGLLRGRSALLRSPLTPLVAPPILCAVVLLYAQGADPAWGLIILTLMASALALMGVGALTPRRRLGLSALSEAWRPLQRGKTKPMSEHDRYATRVGTVALALAVICAAPLALASRGAMWLLVAFTVVALVFYGLDGVRPLLAPVDDVIAALCLGPGIVLLTVMAQGQVMTLRDWMVASAFGCMALGVIEGRRLITISEENALRGRTLAMLVGPRRALLLAGGAMALAFALAVVIAVTRPALPGALLALAAFPTALVALSGLGVSRYAPTRQIAAAQLARAYAWFGLALAVGLAVTLIVQGFIGAFVRSLIG